MKLGTWEENETILSEAIEGKVHIAFSVGPPSDTLMYYHLKEVAQRGKVKFIREDDGFGGPGSDYESEVLIDPTWLDAAKAANESIETVNDYHHIFLEDLRPAGTDDSVRIFRFVMGL